MGGSEDRGEEKAKAESEAQGPLGGSTIHGSAQVFGAQPFEGISSCWGAKKGAENILKEV